ncbi:MAG: N-acetyltransferase family protein [Candidatus Natronoplasma sp.]
MYLGLERGCIRGMSSHWKKEKENSLFTGLTGVRRKYRGKGIATAMKVKAIKTAEKKGFDKIKTMKETGNEGMLHINQRLGFEKKTRLDKLRERIGYEVRGSKQSEISVL